MLEEQLIRDLNKALIELTGELGEVKSTLRQYELTFENINNEISKLNKNINKNNITIAKATGFVGAIALIISTSTTLVLKYFKLI